MKTQNLKTVRLLLVITPLALASCVSPKAVIRMNPASQDVRWNYGQAFACDTVSGVIIEAAFSKSTPEYNVFDVSVTNNSNMDYVADPATFLFLDVTSGAQGGNAIKAINPEDVLLSIDKQISQREADSKNAAIGAGIALGVLTAASIAVAVADNEPVHHAHFRQPNPDLLMAAPIIIDASHDDQVEHVSSIEQQREMWATATIRKTTVAPGYKVEGKVFFPRFEKPGTYLLRVPVDDQFVEISFIQLTY